MHVPRTTRAPVKAPARQGPEERVCRAQHAAYQIMYAINNNPRRRPRKLLTDTREDTTAPLSCLRAPHSQSPYHSQMGELSGGHQRSLRRALHRHPQSPGTCSRTGRRCPSSWRPCSTLHFRAPEHGGRQCKRRSLNPGR